ncbi:hypothetical protein [Dactylococcopsis salina]|uniref:hypothetical protein n=1 Tax=Dactylococcopsis salina TaxID=292566 RepID=UPI000315548B|nr:hypothetical protein [Dactylococcopsis salina]
MAKSRELLSSLREKSEDNFQNQGKQELTYFQASIAPLLEKNFYRNVDEYGRFEDEFWRIDLIFIGFFAIELTARTRSLSRRSSVSIFSCSKAKGKRQEARGLINR